VGDNLALAVQITSTLIVGFLIAFVADWKLTLIILCVMPLLGVQGYAQVKFLKGFSQDAKVIYQLLILGFMHIFSDNQTRTSL
jgi:ATP-binding cassette subfamily B (MDR/TAP) protein 1